MNSSDSKLEFQSSRRFVASRIPAPFHCVSTKPVLSLISSGSGDVSWAAVNHVHVVLMCDTVACHFILHNFVVDLSQNMPTSQEQLSKNPVPRSDFSSSLTSLPPVFSVAQRSSINSCVYSSQKSVISQNGVRQLHARFLQRPPTRPQHSLPGLWRLR